VNLLFEVEISGNIMTSSGHWALSCVRDNNISLLQVDQLEMIGAKYVFVSENTEESQFNHR
jgi:hypothetical protein